MKKGTRTSNLQECALGSQLSLSLSQVSMQGFMACTPHSQLLTLVSQLHTMETAGSAAGQVWNDRGHNCGYEDLLDRTWLLLADHSQLAGSRFANMGLG